MTPTPPRPITDSEKIFQYMKDITVEYQKEILMSKEVERIINERSTINLN